MPTSSGSILMYAVPPGSFSGTTLTSGDYEAVDGGTLDLDMGAPIVTDAASIVLGLSTDGADEVRSAAGTAPVVTDAINSFDPGPGLYVPLQMTLQGIAGSGSLQIVGQRYVTADTLAVAGALTLTNGDVQAATLSTGGLEVAAAGAVTGEGTVAGPIVNDGTITSTTTPAGGAGESTAGALTLQGPVSGAGVIEVGSGAVEFAFGHAGEITYVFVSSTLELAGPASEPVRFADGTGILRLDDPGDFTGTIAPAPTEAVYSPAALFSDDQIVLPGVSMASVTAYSYSGDANGGTLTIQEGSAQQRLAFSGSFTTSSFSLAAGAQADPTSPPSLDVTVQAVPFSPTIALLTPGGSATKAIINSDAPTVLGTSPNGSTLTLLADGAAEGRLSDAYGGVRSTFGDYQVALDPGLGLGAQSVVAAATDAAGSARSAPLDLFVLPGPVNGITSSDDSSLDLSTLLGQGYGMQFVSGTEAVQLSDGTLSLGPDTNEAYVQRLYEGLLGRGGDAVGLTGDDQALAGGASVADVADGLLSSAEYQSVHGAAAMTDTEFVTSLYQGFLGRAPDPGGLAAYAGALGHGATRAQMAASVALSDECKAYLAPETANVWVPNTDGALVTDVYKTAFDRDVDATGLQTWTQQLQAGLTAAGLTDLIAASAEFQSDHAGQSPADYVTGLYEDGLGRAPDPGGLQAWAGALEAGASQASVLLGIAMSPEAQIHLSPSL